MRRAAASFRDLEAGVVVGGACRPRVGEPLQLGGRQLQGFGQVYEVVDDRQVPGRQILRLSSGEVEASGNAGTQVGRFVLFLSFQARARSCRANFSCSADGGGRLHPSMRRARISSIKRSVSVSRFSSQLILMSSRLISASSAAAFLLVSSSALYLLHPGIRAGSSLRSRSADAHFLDSSLPVRVESGGISSHMPPAMLVATRCRHGPWRILWYWKWEQSHSAEVTRPSTLRRSVVLTVRPSSCV